VVCVGGAECRRLSGCDFVCRARRAIDKQILCGMLSCVFYSAGAAALFPLSAVVCAVPVSFLAAGFFWQCRRSGGNCCSGRGNSGFPCILYTICSLPCTSFRGKHFVRDWSFSTDQSVCFAVFSGVGIFPVRL